MLGPVHEGEERGIDTCSLDTLRKAAQSAGSVFLCILNFSSLLQAVPFAKEKKKRNWWVLVCLTIFLKTSLWKVWGQVAGDLPLLKINRCSGRLPALPKHTGAASWLPSLTCHLPLFFLLSWLPLPQEKDQHAAMVSGVVPMLPWLPGGAFYKQLISWRVTDLAHRKFVAAHFPHHRHRPAAADTWAGRTGGTF